MVRSESMVRLFQHIHYQVRQFDDRRITVLVHHLEPKGPLVGRLCLLRLSMKQGDDAEGVSINTITPSTRPWLVVLWVDIATSSDRPAVSSVWNRRFAKGVSFSGPWFWTTTMGRRVHYAVPMHDAARSRFVGFVTRRVRYGPEPPPLRKPRYGPLPKRLLMSPRQPFVSLW
jgi:hypothetical protein